MRLNKAVYIFLLFVLLSPGVSFGGEEGETLKDFTFEGIDGETLKVSELKGKPVVLVIAATWCPPCKREAPDLEKAYLDYKDKGVEFLGVFVASSERSIKKFAEKYGLTFPVGKGEGITEQFGFKSFPKTAFVARDGKIKSLHSGEIKYEELVRGIEEIME